MPSTDANNDADCVLNLSGATYCQRNLVSEQQKEHGLETHENFLEAQAEANDQDLAAISAVDPAVSTKPNDEKREKSADKGLFNTNLSRAGPSPRGEHALVCVNRDISMTCSAAGYFCTRQGVLSHKAGPAWPYRVICNNECFCHNLNPKPKNQCLVRVDGTSYCV